MVGVFDPWWRRRWYFERFAATSLLPYYHYYHYYHTIPYLAARNKETGWPKANRSEKRALRGYLHTKVLEGLSSGVVIQ